MTQQEFGERILQLRKQMGLSQLEVSLRCDVQISYIGSIELGKKNPTLSTLTKLANGLGLTLSELLAESEPKINQNDEIINKAISYLAPMRDETRRDAITVLKILARNQ